MSTPSENGERRNPGPSWGYQFLRATDRVLPEFVFKPLRAIGTAVAMAGMSRERRHSRTYLRLALGREPGIRDVFRHFFAFEEALMLRLRIVNGRHYPCSYAQEDCAFEHWMKEGGEILIGTMHVGATDMMGFQLAGQQTEVVHMVRHRVGNSHDVDRLMERFRDRLRIIWVNSAEEIPFALKEAAAEGGAITLQCDRTDHASRTELFRFLGEERVFPFTIYHLALIFRRPVILCFGVPDGEGASLLSSSPAFVHEPGETKADYLVRARTHFAGFLELLEDTLRVHPYLWFNFTRFDSQPEGVGG